MKTVVWGLLIPFIGTAAGAACVFFLNKDLRAGGLYSRMWADYNQAVKWKISQAETGRKEVR
ncbi:MAG: hypothetical protein J5493_01455 [Lachnospiraceae bacterium]|nr:hypothetical protein [Lachnospiraceae bacterium]